MTSVTSDARFLRELRLRAIFIEPRHGKPAIARDRLRIVHRDQAIGIARISDHEDANILRGIFFDRLPLADENLAVDPEQILPLHPSFARNTSNEQRPIHIPKSFIEIGGGDDVFQERERAIIQFHDDPLERLEAGWDFDQVQRDRLVRTKHRA